MKLKMLKAVCMSFAMVGMSILMCKSSKMPSAHAYGQDYWIDNLWWFYIKNAESGQYLDVYNGNTSQGTNVIQHPFNGGQNQRWRFHYIGSGVYKIVSVQTGMVLDIDGSPGGNIDSNGRNITVWSDNGGLNQRFALERKSDSSVIIRTAVSSYAKAVVVQNATCTPGENVFQWTYNNNSTHNDEWFIEPVFEYWMRPDIGVDYALKNCNRIVPAYPNMGSFLPNYDNSTNFVSQCMSAAGVSYQDEWRIHKKNNSYPAPSTPSSKKSEF